MRSDSERRLDFIVIGAMRAGTTSLWMHLVSHPALYLPPDKEAPFFSSDRHFKAGLDWYFDQFFASAPRGARWGTSTPQYMRGGRGVPAEVVAERIAHTFPDIKLVAILRDPIERATSHYRLSTRRGHEQRSFEQAVDELLRAEQLERARAYPTDTNAYLTCSEYGRILSAYFDVLPPEQIHVTFTAELERTPLSVMLRIYEHIGVAHGHVPPRAEAKHNAGGTRERIGEDDAAAIARYLEEQVWPSVPDNVRGEMRRAYGPWFLTWNVVPERAAPLESLVHAELGEALREHLRETRACWLGSGSWLRGCPPAARLRRARHRAGDRSW